MQQLYIIWGPDPVIFQTGTFSLRWYSLFLLISFYLSYRFMLHIYDTESKSRKTVLSYGLYIIAGLFIGGRLIHCLAYEPGYYLAHPWEIILPWRGQLGVNAHFVGYKGMSGHGSAIGITLAIILNSLRTGTSMIWMIDRIAIFGPLIGFFVRLGNLFNSEILGKASDLPWAFVFLRADQVARHPVQLYEALSYLIIFIICYRYYKKHAGREKPGSIIGLVLILVYIARFFLEFFKDKQSDVESGMLLNMGHLLSIPFILTGLILFFRPQKKKQLPSREKL